MQMKVDEIKPECASEISDSLQTSLNIYVPKTKVGE
jgi:hypothetical protein